MSNILPQISKEMILSLRDEIMSLDSFNDLVQAHVQEWLGRTVEQGDDPEWDDQVAMSSRTILSKVIGQIG